MRFTTTTTSKGQLTIPKPARDKLGLKKGVKVDIYVTAEDTFIGRLRRKSKILDFAGSLKHLDKGESWQEIREKTHKLAAEEIVERMQKNENSRG